MKITITEALAEIPTIEKRIDKKREFILNYLYRQAVIRDPLEKDGGSPEIIKRETQAITDLWKRAIAIRAAIQRANLENMITVENDTRTITDWLTWRREVAPKQQQFLANINSKLVQMRAQANKQGVGVKETDSGFSADYIVNINEKSLAEEIEKTETILGILDGQLSLKNATITIDI